jgi:hypothetical protein
VIQAQVHGHCCRGHLQRQCCGHVHCRESTAQESGHCRGRLSLELGTLFYQSLFGNHYKVL